MARRRGGGDKIFNKRQERKNKSHFNRRKATLKKLPSIILACEGTKTEPNYFSSYFNYLVKTHKLSATSFVIAKHKHTNPTGVLEDLLNHKEGDITYKNFTYKWIVIDRDETITHGGGHSQQDYNNAISKALSLDIGVAYSNPAFEIWYLLHYQYRNTAIDRDSVVKELEKIIDYKKNSTNIFDILLPNMNTAIRNARRLANDCHKNIGNCNPSTSMYELVECLNEMCEEG